MKKKTLCFAALILLVLTWSMVVAEEAANSDNPGQEVDIATYLRRGLINIIDFYSEYCPPCRRISPLLAKLDQKRTDIVVVKLDINRKGVTRIDFISPLARQYSLEAIPHFKIFDGTGKLLKEGEDAYRQVLEWLQEEKVIQQP